MHEVGLLYTIADTASRYAEENHASSVESISLDIGELAGVLPDIFTEYFDYVAGQYAKLSHAKLRIHMIPGEAMCTRCGSMYNVMKNEGVCPSCGERGKRILSGQNLLIRNIVITEMQDEKETGEEPAD